MTAGLEVTVGLVSRLTGLSCLEERASLAELGRNRMVPREARWDNMTAQLSSRYVMILTGGVWRDGRLWWRNQERTEEKGGVSSRSDSRGMSQLSILLLRQRYVVNICHINIVVISTTCILVRCETVR